MSMQASFLGQLLDHRYRVISPLAAGGFGQTYIAEDTRRPGNPKCVVKHLKPASSDLKFLDHARRLFATEAETLEELGNHVQIPRLLAYFEDNEEFFLVQELINGHPLANELQPGKQWSENQVYPLLWEVLNILVFVHRNNVIHRDIKPENLLRRHQDRQFVLVDFGTVKQIRTQMMFQGQPTATISIGTPGYMPTEQSHGRPRPSSDIYALGMIGIQAVTGLMPMQLPEDVETGELLWQDRSAISPELSNILARMTRYHFKDRYQSATEVLQDLESLINRCGIVPVNERESVTLLRPTVISLDNTPPYHKTIVALPPTVISQKTVDNIVEEARAEPNIDPIAKSKLTVSEDISNPEVERISELIIEQIPESNIKTEIIDLQTIDEIELESTIAPIVQPIREPLVELAQTKSEPTVEHETAIAPVIEPDFEIEAVKTVRPVWLIGGSALIIGIGIMVGGSYFAQRQAYLKAQETLGSVNSLQAVGQYEKCAQQASIISEQYSDLYTQAQESMGDCWLAQAKALAKQRKFKDAIAQTGKISASMEAYPQAQSLTDQWSEAILKTATEQYRQGKLPEAKTIAQAIPPTAAVAPQAKQTIQQWQAEWQKNEEILKAAQRFLSSSQWQKALDQISKIRILGQPVSPNSVYWKTRVKEIATQANRELEAIAQKEAAAQADRQSPPPRSNYSSDSGSEGYSGGGISSGSSDPPAAAPPLRLPSDGGSNGGWIERRL